MHSISPPSPSPSPCSSESLSPAPSFASSPFNLQQTTREDSLSNTSTITVPSEMDSINNSNHNLNEKQPSLLCQEQTSSLNNQVQNRNQNQSQSQQNQNQPSWAESSGLLDREDSSTLDSNNTRTTSNTSTANPRRTQRTRQPPPRSSNSTTVLSGSSVAPSASVQNGSSNSTSGAKQSTNTNTNTNTSNSGTSKSTPRSSNKKNDASASPSPDNASNTTQDPRGPTRRGQPRKLFRYLQDYEALGLGSAQAAKEAAEQSQAIAAQQEAQNSKGKGKKRAPEDPSLGPDGKPKRRNTAKACLFCKRSHMTCDDIRPCQRCVKRGIGHLCTDEVPGSAGAPAPASAASHASPTIKGKAKASVKASKLKARRASDSAVSKTAASATHKPPVKLPRATKARASVPGSSSAILDDDDECSASRSVSSKQSSVQPQRVKQEFPAYVAAPSNAALSSGNVDSDSDSDSEDEDAAPLLKIEAERSVPTGVPAAAREPALFHGDGPGPERSYPFAALRRNTVQAEEFNVRTLGLQSNHTARGNGNGHSLQIETDLGSGKSRQCSPQPQTAPLPLDHSVYQTPAHPMPHHGHHHSSVSPHSYHTQPSIVHRMPTHPQSATIPSVSSFWPGDAPMQSYHHHHQNQNQHMQHLHGSQGYQQYHQRHLHEMSGNVAEIDNSSAVFEDFLRQHQQQQQPQTGSQPLDPSDWPAYGAHTRHMSLPQTGIGSGLGYLGMQSSNHPLYEMNVSEPKYFSDRPDYPAMDHHQSSQPQLIGSRSNSFSHGQSGNVGLGLGGQAGNPLDYQRTFHSASPFSPDLRSQEVSKATHPISVPSQAHLGYHHQHQVLDSNQHHPSSSSSSSSLPFDSYHSSNSNSACQGMGHAGMKPHSNLDHLSFTDNSFS